MYISAKTDYATRALLTLSAAGGGPVKGELLAREQGLPLKFLENTLTQLRHAGLLNTQRGVDGGYRLARSADQITLADIMRALDGPLAEVRGEKPEEAVYEGPATRLRDVWVAVRAALREVLENVTLADIVAGELPSSIEDLLSRPGAWERRSPAGRATEPAQPERPAGQPERPAGRPARSKLPAQSKPPAQSKRPGRRPPRPPR